MNPSCRRTSSSSRMSLSLRVGSKLRNSFIGQVMIRSWICNTWAFLCISSDVNLASHCCIIVMKSSVFMRGWWVVYIPETLAKRQNTSTCHSWAKVSETWFQSAGELRLLLGFPRKCLQAKATIPGGLIVIKTPSCLWNVCTRWISTSFCTQSS